MTSAARELGPTPAAPAAPIEEGVGREALGLRLPAARVRTDRAAVAAFQAAAAQPVEDRVPLTFPFCWLALPLFRSAIAELIGGDGFLPIHESQSFGYASLLDLDADYVLEVDMERTENPPRLRLNGVVSTPQGVERLRLEAILRIVPIASAAAQ